MPNLCEVIAAMKQERARRMARRAYAELTAHELAEVERWREKLERLAEDLQELKHRVGAERFALIMGGFIGRADLLSEERGLRNPECLPACLIWEVAETALSHLGRWEAVRTPDPDPAAAPVAPPAAVPGNRWEPILPPSPAEAA